MVNGEQSFIDAASTRGEHKDSRMERNPERARQLYDGRPDLSPEAIEARRRWWLDKRDGHYPTCACPACAGKRRLEAIRLQTEVAEAEDAPVSENYL